VRMPIPTLVVCGLAAACWAVGGGATPIRAQAAPAQGSTTGLALHIFQDAVENARAAYGRLAGPQPRVVPGNAQYQDGLAKLQAGQFLEAQTALQAAVRANPNSALYHGDLAAVQIALQSVDDASLELVRARQIQPQNQWYTVGLAAVKALRQQFSDASLNLDVAVSADSSIVDSAVAEAGVSWSWRGRRNAQTQAWAELATRRWPGIAEPWLRLAALYRPQHDTAKGMAAIQHYLSLRPDDRSGQYLYAVYLYDVGRADSAVVMAAEAAQDSTNRESAAVILFNIGARAFQAAQDTTAAARVHQMEKLDLAIGALSRMQPIAPPELAPRAGLFLGFAQLMKVAALDHEAEANRACAPAQQLDTLLTLAGANLRLGVALDSARVTGILTNTMPQYRDRARALVNQICGGSRRP
jgi:tetratricopeptide (TPR) repeat protein